jgi:glycolate oxidase FAD binding subunit
MRTAQLEPAAVVAVSRAGGAELRFDLGFKFEGFAHGVADQADKMVALARHHDAPASALDDAGAAAFWRRHDAVRSAAPLRVRIADQPTNLPVIAPVIAPLGDVTWYATLGVGFAGKVDGAPVAPAAITAARTAVTAHGGALVLEAAPPDVRAQVDVWGPVPASFPIMQQLKRRFDPNARLNPGRLVGGL